MKKKINAYTITELLVVLLISTLVVTCILQLLAYTNAYTVSMLRKQDSQREVMHCLTYLRSNATRSENIAYTDDKILFFYSHKQPAYLNLAPKVVLVQESLKDTLNISFLISDTINLSNDNLKVIEFCLCSGQKKYNTIVQKQYSRDYLLNQVERREYFTKSVTR